VAPVMAVSGVRRSWETELSKAFRSRSVSTLALCLLGLFGEAHPLQGQGGLAGKDFQPRALLWGQDTTRLGGPHPQQPPPCRARPRAADTGLRHGPRRGPQAARW